MDLVNELVWSFSRGRQLHTCARAYWYTYYGSWGGWDTNAPGAAQQAYAEKKLTTRAMWTGTLVHQVAERALRRAMRREAAWPLDRVLEGLRHEARRDYQTSISGAWRARPARMTGFAEHYYQTPITPEDWRATFDEMARQVQNLHDNRIFQRLQVTATRIREVEELRRFTVGDAEVWLAIDAMVGDGQGGVVIIDWKTGDNHDDAEVAEQLGVYGLYAVEVLAVPPERIVAMHVNLRHQTETRHTVGPQALQAARELIHRDVSKMRDALRDVSKNIADEADFPRVELGPKCQRCNFRRSCGREDAARP